MTERLRKIVDDLDIRPSDRPFTEAGMRVGIFHRRPELADARAQRWLAPGGRVFALFDPPNR